MRKCCNSPATGPCQCAGRLPHPESETSQKFWYLPIHTLGGPVVDRTGLGRSYDYLVDWLDEQLRLKPDANTDLVEGKTASSEEFVGL